LLPSETIAKASVPDGSELCLVRRGDEWTIRVGNAVLMSSRQHASEEALAELTLAISPRAKHVLVGGLGLGYTLRAVLNKLEKNGIVTISELLPELVEWNRKYLGPLNDYPLMDNRCEVVIGDVYELIKRATQTFDVILLDVDNGPAALSDARNQRLYTERGVRTCFAALRPKGVLAVWSAGQSPNFDSLLTSVGFKISTQRVAKVRGARASHILHIGQRN
jgi:spermidine synthase